MKKILNNPENTVQEMIEGMVCAFPDDIKVLEGTTVIARKDGPIANKVAIISGGGSGHEPAHAGYVGKGMLDAAVVGEVFTSPSVDQVYEAIKGVNADSGVLLIIKNYTGDVMNFEMAREMAEAEGIEVSQVIVKDDVAVEDSSFTTGRRGVAGTVFVHKIAGAKAETGAKLTEVKRIAEKTSANIRSMGVAITPCTVPQAGKPSFELTENEMEVGIGIHGEPGIQKKLLTSAFDIANELITKIIGDFEVNSGDEVAVLINGMGSTPEMELFIINKEVDALLKAKGIHIYKTYVGEYMTALEMGGCSITLLKLDDELKELLDAQSEAPNF